MSLATRCTACGTVFRVVQDQLKVSEGWVRCGRCDEVFNALEGLFDLGRDAPPEQSEVEVAPAHAAEATTTGFRDPLAASDPSLVDRLDAHLRGARRTEPGSSPATRINSRDRLDFPDARFDTEPAGEDEAPLDFGDAQLARINLEPASPVPGDTPEFMQRAQRDARWQGPMVRTALATTAFVLLCTLALQVGHHFRDLISARAPNAAPALAAWCRLVDCTIETARRIDDISVESTALTRAALPDAFKLSVALRNRGSIALAMPSVDLSLTDATGQLVARRVLSPRDFRASSTTLQPGAESALQLLLTAGSGRVSGYTVEVFYP